MSILLKVSVETFGGKIFGRLNIWTIKISAVKFSDSICFGNDICQKILPSEIFGD